MSRSIISEYNPLATCEGDDVCITIIVEGCTYLGAENYNVNATSDDGSCIVYGCSYFGMLNYDENVTIDDGNSSFQIILRVVQIRQLLTLTHMQIQILDLAFL